MKPFPPFTVIPQEAGHTVAKILRSRLHESAPSWADVKAAIVNRRVRVGDALCTDPARRLKENDVVTLLNQPEKLQKAATTEGLVVRYLDDHVVVVEKPTGMNTVRHPAELDWPEERRRLDPTLQDIALWVIAERIQRPVKQLAPLRIVHRLDRDTSGLVCFARTAAGEKALGMQFRKHTVIRRYLALVPGIFTARTITSELVRDRGDGRRGSTPLPNVGKKATTHVSVEESLKGFTFVSCRLETGRTHQIRIHLSESGHPVCGERVYNRTRSGEELPDGSRTPRLFLHATELGFTHPITAQPMHWSMPLPNDLERVLVRLRAG
jgi:23S rRNA pseudouridine1911/1915/1917 synthase